MSHKVVILESAINDIASIYDYIELNDSGDKAEYVLEELEKCINSLAELQSRGRNVEELAKQGIVLDNTRQTSFKPYRIIYSIEGKVFKVKMVVDGRRDLEDILMERLLRA